MVKVIDEVAAAHGPLPLACKVKVTLPLVISVEPGVYVGFNVLVLLKVPLPLVVQSKLASLDAVAPLRLIAPEFEQVVWLAPAKAEGAVVKVKVLEEDAATQGDVAATVIVSVTLPAAKSALLGI